MSKSSILKKGKTILGETVKILRKSGPLGPSEVAEKGIQRGIFQVPRFRTRSYLTQRIQSTLYNDSAYSDAPSVKRVSAGTYRAR